MRYLTRIANVFRPKRSSNVVSVSVAKGTKGVWGWLSIEHGEWSNKQKTEVF